MSFSYSDWYLFIALEKIIQNFVAKLDKFLVNSKLYGFRNADEKSGNQNQI